MTLTELEQDVYRNTGHPESPAADVVKRIRAYINQAHREILRDKRWGHKLRRQVLTTASVADEVLMALPQAVSRVHHLVDRVDDHRLEPKTLDWLRSVDPALNSSANNPWAWVPWAGVSPVSRQPSSAAQIFTKSTSAGDTQIAYIEGVTSTGNMVLDQITLTGTVAVWFATADIIKITKLWLSTAAVGTVTIHHTSSVGTQLAEIYPTKTSAKYPVVHLYPTPSEVRTYHVDCDVAVRDMAISSDEPMMPEDFHHMLALKAMIKEWSKRDKAKVSSQYFSELKRAERELTSHLRGEDPNSNDTARHSQLGSWFPAGT